MKSKGNSYTIGGKKERGAYLKVFGKALERNRGDLPGALTTKGKYRVWERTNVKRGSQT